jgi:hypothetical protein
MNFYPALDGDVSEADLLEFLAMRVEENQILEYKRTLDAPKSIPVVAAFANGYGGYLLLGVGETELPTGRAIPDATPTPLPADAGTRFRNACFEKLDPPWVPDIVAVNVGTAGKVVLVVRVPPQPQLRPIAHDGAVYLRYGDQTRAAPREEIRRLFSEATDAEPTFVPNPHAFVGSTGFGIELTGKWFVVRAVATAALPPGLAVKPLDESLRQGIAAVVRDGPADEWLKSLAVRWRCDPQPWDVSGETHSGQYGLQRLATLPHGKDGAIHARVLVGASAAPNRLAGFWCVVDMSFSTVNQRNDDRLAARGSRLVDQKPSPVPFVDLGHILAAGLDTADDVLKVVVEANDEPRPRVAYFAAGLIGGLASNVDVASLGRFTRDLEQGGDNIALTEPRVVGRLGELDSSASASAFLDRLLLDRGFVTAP